jgi:hypothetical protein
MTEYIKWLVSNNSKSITQNPCNTTCDIDNYEFPEEFDDITKINIKNNVNDKTNDTIISEYSQCISDDNQVTNEIIALMKSFEMMKTKIVNFENNIKEFEKNIESKNHVTINNEKIKDIETKLENTIILINNINFGSEEFLIRILHLENSIKENELHRKEFISKFEKFNKEYNEIKQKQIIVDNIIFNNNNSFGNIYSYTTYGIITFGIAFVISKVFIKNK